MSKNTRAEMRGDLIKRLFAVAISVGAANTIARMHWVIQGNFPDFIEWKQISILIVAMTATVLSWDGYLTAIESRPLNGFWRFTIDIFLIFTYLFLLITSIHQTWWLPIHIITFILYVIWDFLTVKEHTEAYWNVDVPPKNSILGVYTGGLSNSADVNRGPVITIFWTIYFIALYIIVRNYLSNLIFSTSVLALIGLVLYRQDKYYKASLCLRILCVAALLLTAYFCTSPLASDENIASSLGLK